MGRNHVKLSGSKHLEYGSKRYADFATTRKEIQRP
jgi:hypothetical protein